MFSAQLDTCVLYPSYLRDVLLQIAQHGVYRALWSAQILDELARALRVRHLARGHDAHTVDAYVRRLLEQMETAFPDALVENWHSLVPTVTLPDPDDRHVVAAALVGRADVIVTQNLRDFPPEALPRPLLVQDADVFLLDSLDLYPDAVIAAVRTVAARTGRHGPVLGPAEVVTAIHEAPGFANEIGNALPEHPEPVTSVNLAPVRRLVAPASRSRAPASVVVRRGERFTMFTSCRARRRLAHGIPTWGASDDHGR